MGSPEIFRPQENNPHPEVPRSGPLKSQLSKYVGTETKIPSGKEWALTLIQKIPDTHKKIVTDFIMSLPHEDRQKAAENLSGVIEVMGDQIWRSRYPEVEIQKCIQETQRWLLVNKKKETH